MKVDSRIEMNGYCDGSSKAYSAVVYLRIIPCKRDAGKVLVAKTWVNPIESVTLPRIEMCSALLLARLSASILETLPIQIKGVYLWSDSQIVLSWIHLPPKKGNHFAINRVAQIKSLVPQAQWNHIAGTSNPADCASRGISPNSLLKHSLWWSGPQWLSSNEHFSPFLIETFVIEPEFDCFKGSRLNHSGEILKNVKICKCPDTFGHILYSDNGKNFTGLANQLKALLDILKSTPVQEYVASQFIRWHFIPPYSPHFGEIWEAAVKQTKNHLLRACRAAVLNFEELSTLLCQVEACLNSRPLIPVLSDPSDVRALAPGHFLIGSPLLEIPDSNHEGDLQLALRWHLIQFIRQNFWKR
ncbi:hypothetical protein AVEN_83152-1 [Araneus ventricosus]|uniref:Integrase catalytic domain-containing protein n=1 Tax=Araneus ventricosus TaxID=182803 RepID=A0A4Y2AMX0_ARAVE|nr:hypothetical protein AVEN_83152-1 [Araneus ventricosus]